LCAFLDIIKINVQTTLKFTKFELSTYTAYELVSSTIQYKTHLTH